MLTCVLPQHCGWQEKNNYWYLLFTILFLGSVHVGPHSALPLECMNTAEMGVTRL